jgi:hypothetical protein
LPSAPPLAIDAGMTRSLLILIIASAGAFAVEIPDTLVVDGQTYKGIVYQSHDASRLRVMHETGVASLPIGSLPADLQTKLGYNANAASAAEAASAAQQRQYAAAQVERERQMDTAKKLDEAAITIEGRVFQVLPDGVLLDSEVETIGTITQSQQVGTGNLLRPDEKKTVVKERQGTVRKRLSPGKYIFVMTKGTFVDGSKYSGTIYPMGTHTFTTAIGAASTVAAFTDIPEAVMKAHGLQ